MQRQLKDTVLRKSHTGYLFADINNDLGEWSKSVLTEPLLAQMAYAYARRIAVLGLYAQGLVDRDVVDHVSAIFKAQQVRTGQTVEFQEAAFAESNLLIISYHPMATGLFSKSLAQWYQDNADLSQQPRRTDAELLGMVLEHAYIHQEERSGLLKTVETQQGPVSDDGYYTQLSDSLFAELPLHHESWEAATAHAEREDLKVYLDQNGSYFTAPHGYVQPEQMTFDDENIL